MRELFLVLHLGGAAVLGVLGIAAIMNVLWKQKKAYKPLASTIAFGGATQLITGSLLALTSQGTVLAFCARIGIYMTAVAAIETILFVAMRKNNLAFPAHYVIPAFSLGVVVATITTSLL